MENLWDRLWRDKKGRVVIWQRPNILLIGWAVLTTISLFVGRKTGDMIAIAGDITLIAWAILELLKGVNYFRRLLGLAVLIFAVVVLLRNFH